jgi:hypothetical protein
VRPLAFLPHALDRVAVAVHIRDHVDDRRKGNHDCRDADRPQARLPVMIVLQWSGTAGLGGSPAVPVAPWSIILRGLSRREYCLNSEPGWRVAELARRKTNLTFSWVAGLGMPGRPLTACPNRNPDGRQLLIVVEWLHLQSEQ